MQVNRESLSQKLQGLNSTQQSIENTAKWCIFYHQDARNVVSIWSDQFMRAQPDKRMTLMYLANHILQEGRKKGKEFMEEFYKALPKCLKLLARAGDEKSKKSVDRLIKIWDERKVFGSSQVKHLKDVMAGTAEPPSTPTGGGTTTPDDKLKLQIVGPLADVLLEVQHCEHLSRAVVPKVLQLRPSLVQDGSQAELKGAQDQLGSCLMALGRELAARRKCVATLKQLLEQQEDALARSQEQNTLFEQQKAAVSGRLKAMAEAPALPVAAQQPTVPPAMPVPAPAAALVAGPSDGHYAGVQQQHQQPAMYGAPPPASHGQAPLQQQVAVSVAGTSYTSLAWAAPAGAAGTDALTSGGMGVAPVQQDFATSLAGAQPSTTGDAAAGAAPPDINSDVVAVLAAQLANSNETAMLLANMLANMPQEEREKFGMGGTDDLNQAPAAGDFTDAGLGDAEYDPEYPD